MKIWKSGGIAAIGVFIISHINVTGLTTLTAIFAAAITLQIIIFVIFTRGIKTIS